MKAEVPRPTMPAVGRTSNMLLTRGPERGANLDSRLRSCQSTHNLDLKDARATGPKKYGNSIALIGGQRKLTNSRQRSKVAKLRCVKI